MNAHQKQEIEEYIKDGLESVQKMLDVLNRGGILLYNGKKLPADEALAREQATMELYQKLQEDFDAGNFETDRMLLVRRLLDENRKTAPVKALDPFVKIVNSGSIAGLMQCFNVGSNGERDIDGKTYTATQIQVSDKLQATITWIGGELKSVGIKLAHFIMANYYGASIITFSLQDFMHYAGLSDRDKAAEMVMQESQKLASLQWLVEETSKRRTGKGWFGLYGIYYKNNVITVTLTIEGEAMLKAARGFAYFPIDLLKRNLKDNPHSITLGSKLSYLKAMNWGKPNCDTYGALWLIRGTEIPDPEDVKEYQFKNLIITPFERDMNANQDIYKWEYIQGSGDAWKQFQIAVVKIVWKNHPQDLLKRPKPKPKLEKKAK